MAKSKTAGDNELSSLHKLLATVLADQLGEAVTEEDEDGKETVVFTATPALLTIAARFLKDNSITCEVEDSEEMSALEEQLKVLKKNRGKIASISQLMPDEAHG